MALFSVFVLALTINTVSAKNEYGYCEEGEYCCFEDPFFGRCATVVDLNCTGVCTAGSYPGDDFVNETGDIMSGDLNITTGTSYVNISASGNINLSGDITLRDTDLEWHRLSTVLLFLDELTKNTVLTGINGSLDGTTFTISEHKSENISVNINETQHVLNRTIDSITIIEGTNSTPVFNQLYYRDINDPRLEKRNTLSALVPSAATILMGKSFVYASAVGASTGDRFVGNVFTRFFVEAPLYLGGFNIDVSPTEINISIGTMMLLASTQHITSNHSTTDLAFEIHSDGNFHQHINNLSGFDRYSTGEVVGNNKYFNMVCGIVSTHDNIGRMYCSVQNIPPSEHTRVLDAELDHDYLVFFPTDDFVKFLYVPVVRVIMKRAGGVNTIQPLSSGLLFDDIRGDVVGTGGAAPTPIPNVWLEKSGDVGTGDFNFSSGTSYVNISASAGAINMTGNLTINGSIYVDSTHDKVAISGHVNIGGESRVAEDVILEVRKTVNVDDLSAIIAQPKVSGAHTNAYGFWFQMDFENAAADLINSYSNYIADPAFIIGADVTNNYGLYIEAMTRGGTSNYAIYSAGGVIYSAGNVGIGEATPQSLLSVQGDMGVFSGSGWVNITAAAGTINVSRGATFGDRVGIETDKPTLILHINGTPRSNNAILFTNHGTGQAVGDGLFLGMGTDDNFYIVSRENERKILFYTENTVRMTINGSGNVGIGTTSPAADLHIAKSEAGGLIQQIIENSDAGANNNRVILDLTTGAATVGYSAVRYGGGGRFWSVGVDYSDGDKFKITTTSTPTSSEVLTIDISGNVGIGDASPSQTLEVSSSAASTGRIRVTETGDTTDGHYSGLELFDGASFRAGLFKSGASHDVSIWAGATKAMTILASNQNVGIGETTPQSLLSVQGDMGVFSGSGFVNITASTGSMNISNDVSIDDDLVVDGNFIWGGTSGAYKIIFGCEFADPALDTGTECCAAAGYGCAKADHIVTADGESVYSPVACNIVATEDFKAWCDV